MAFRWIAPRSSRRTIAAVTRITTPARLRMARISKTVKLADRPRTPSAVAENERSAPIIQRTTRTMLRRLIEGPGRRLLEHPLRDRKAPRGVGARIALWRARRRLRACGTRGAALGRGAAFLEAQCRDDTARPFRDDLDRPGQGPELALPGDAATALALELRRRSAGRHPC